jgi:hypothetical protein
MILRFSPQPDYLHNQIFRKAGQKKAEPNRPDVLNFTLAYALLIANSFFRKRDSHLVTFHNGQHSSQIDFILARREDRHACLDCKVIPGP